MKILTRLARLALAAAFLVTASSTLAQQATVQQGQGNPNVAEWNVNISGRRGGKTSIVCATNSAGGTTITALAGRKGIELQNLGPNAVYCTIDGQAPLATGALGRKVLPVAQEPGNTWSLDAGATVVFRCIAATAAQTTPACLQVSELR
jgi:hypothetical protein